MMAVHPYRIRRVTTTTNRMVTILLITMGAIMLVGSIVDTQPVILDHPVGMAEAAGVAVETVGDPMKVTILDTESGIRTALDDYATAYWWSEGNGSCDCNRSSYVGVDLGFNRIGDSNLGVCAGHKRFLIVDHDERAEYSLRDMNHRYPVELLVAHGIDPDPWENLNHQ